MKRILHILTLGLLVAGVTGQNARAVQIDFFGGYTLSDGADVGTVREKFTFTSGFIFSTDPAVDAITGSTISLATLTLDESSITPTGANFSPSTYVGGFVVPGFFSADLSTANLVISGGTGSINPFLSLNLSNIVPNGGYLSGSSAVADAFIAAGAGASTLTVQISLAQGGDLYNALINASGGGALRNTYSGTASPAVPEGGSALAMLGMGLIGIAAIGRKVRKA